MAAMDLTKILRKDLESTAYIERIIVTGSQGTECNFTKNYKFFVYQIDEKDRESIMKFLKNMLVVQHLPWDKLDYIYSTYFSEYIFERKKIDDSDDYIIIYIYPKNIIVL